MFENDLVHLLIHSFIHSFEPVAFLPYASLWERDGDRGLQWGVMFQLTNTLAALRAKLPYKILNTSETTHVSFQYF